MEAKVVRDSTYGYWHLAPIPSQKELDEYYRNQYFKLIQKGDRAQEIHRQQKGGDEARQELEWLNTTLYNDIRFILGMLTKSMVLLDIGSGTGAFIDYMSGYGWIAEGVEPSMEAGEGIINMSLDEFNSTNNKQYGVVTMLNVLEHVPNPIETLQTVKGLLKPDGIVCIRVPNDFSMFQLIASAELDKRWWVTSPDHINYFNFKSLKAVLEATGFDVVYETTDFPMELFLLMGDNYVGDNIVGGQCHNKRKQFEMSIPEGLRQNMYHKLAQAGVGRSCIVYGKVGT